VRAAALALPIRRRPKPHALRPVLALRPPRVRSPPCAPDLDSQCARRGAPLLALPPTKTGVPSPSRARRVPPCWRSRAAALDRSRQNRASRGCRFSARRGRSRCTLSRLLHSTKARCPTWRSPCAIARLHRAARARVSVPGTRIKSKDLDRCHKTAGAPFPPCHARARSAQGLRSTRSARPTAQRRILRRGGSRTSPLCCWSRGRREKERTR
jgi:hypothetical protein